VALYARVSTDEQREGQNIDSQIEEVRRFAAANQWPVYGVYKDEGWSGAVLARPDLDRLRDDASKGLFKAVVLNDVDRLARDVSHLGIIKRDLERHGVQIVFRKLPTSSSPTHDLMVNILGSFAQFERALIADRTRRGKRFKVEVRKLYVGSHPPFGYRYVCGDKKAGRDGHLEIDPVEAPIVRQIFEWVDAEGLSARRVLIRLNATNYRPRNGGSWAKSTVNRILRCETYAGVWHFGKHQSYEPSPTSTSTRYRRHTKYALRRKPRSEWLAVPLAENLRLVPRDVWTRVQTRLDQNIAFSPRNEKHKYLLKGLLRCGGCSSSFAGNPQHGKFYYRCTEHCKKRPSVQEAVLNQVVWDAVVRAILNPELIAAQVQEQRREDEFRRAPSEMEAEEIKAGLKHADHEENRLLEAYRLEVITASQLSRELEKLKPRKTILLQRQEALQRLPSTPSQQIVEASIADYCSRAAAKVNSLSLEQQQQLLRNIIRLITVEPQSVRILAEIPLGAGPETPDTQKNHENDGGIEATTPKHCGRNPTAENQTIPFELLSEVPKFEEWWKKQARGPRGRYIKGQSVS
jgi:site-specific DNA recombinase